MKYIDSEKLISWIERRIEETKYMKPSFDQFLAGQISAFKGCLNIITSLQQEQPEVDLEKDVESYFFNEVSPKINIEHTMYYYFQECARRYYERGLNARKEEKK